MTDKQRHVWQAIENELRKHGDEDIRAGLAWLLEPEQSAIAQAAIDAAAEVSRET